MKTKNKSLCNKMIIWDLNNIYNDLGKENKYKQLKEAYLKDLFHYSTIIIKKYIQKLEESNNSLLKEEIFNGIKKEFEIQNKKEKENIHLMKNVLELLKIKIKEFNKDNLNKVELEEKEKLSFENFLIKNQIKEKNALIQRMKDSYCALKKFYFCGESNREIYIDEPLEISEKQNFSFLCEENSSKTFYFPNNKNSKVINLNKLNKQISKNLKANEEKIKESIEYLNNVIKIQKEKTHKEKIMNGYISKIYNERFNVNLIIKMRNIDSDDSDCSSISDKISFEELNSEINIIDYYSTDDFSENISDEVNNCKNNNKLLDELISLKKKSLKLKKNRNKYISKIHKIKNINERLKNKIKQLKNTIRISQNSIINKNLIIKKDQIEIENTINKKIKL